MTKPARMTFEQAAALPQAGQLAVQGLSAGGPLKAGQKILFNGAGGGVGTIGIQLAKLQEVEITGVDSAAKLEMMRRIGQDDGSWVAEIPALGGCYALMNTREAATNDGSTATVGQ